MSAEVVYYADGEDISPFVSAEGRPVPRICEVLRRLLDEAERGEIRAVGIAVVSGSAALGFKVNHEHVTSLGTGWALESAARRLCRKLEE